MRNKITLLIISLFCSITAFSQPINSYNDNVMMPPPDAASLGKYGDIPVSYYTGVPNIGVPIHNVAVGPLSLPISVSYHASGVKVGEPASNVGLGWSLQAGGMISRTVQGLKDEDTNGYYYMGTTIPPIEDSCTYYNFILDVNNNLKDPEPDIFSINMPGGSGKFYIDQNHIVVLIPEQDIKIVPQFTLSKLDVSHLKGFIVTTPDGTIYEFGDNGDGSPAFEYTQSDGGNYPKITAGWYLKKIKSFDSKYSINFNYETEYHSFRFGLNNTECGSYNGPPPYLHTWTEGKRLNTITTTPALETVTFTEGDERQDLNVHPLFSGGTYTNQRARELAEISIATGSFSKKYVFDYDYFVDNSSYAISYDPSVNKRLRLLSIQEKSGTMVNPAHTFEYFGKTGNLTFLPHRLSRAIDHWGFYNGADANNGHGGKNIPYTTGTFTHGGTCSSGVMSYPGQSDRESDETAMKYGTVKKITYPTGGYSEFDFEANDYYTTETVEDVEIFTEVNHAFPYPGNCNTSTTSGSPPVAFSSSVLPTVDYYYEMRPSLTCNCNNGPIQVSIQIQATPTSGPTLTSGQINMSPCKTGDVQTGSAKLTTLIPGIVAGMTYTYKIIGTNCAAYFNLSKTTTSVVSINKKVGGLRVKQMTTHDGISTSNDIIRTYDYESSSIPGQSSGKLYNQPQYAFSYSWYPCPGSYCGSSCGSCYGGLPTGGGNVHFFENSVIPLGSFEGYHIGYYRVKENFNGNGYKVYDYFTEAAPSSYSYPVPPEEARVLAGNLSEATTYNSSNAQISKEKNTPKADSYTESTGNIYKVQSAPNGCGSTAPFVKQYILRTRPYRLEKVESTLDGVTTTTDYTYDTAGDHLFPMTEQVTNSDGKVHKTEYSYIFDYPNTTIKMDMEARYMIATPWKTDIKVGTTQVNGSEIEYAYFNNSTGNYQTGSSGASPRPYKFYNYEKTWDTYGTLIGPGKTLKATLNNYDTNGNPKTFTKDGWSAETYTWLNGLIKTRTFLSFTWTYDYYSGTRLLSKITDIDGQFTEFEYDALMRLEKRKGRKTGSVYNNQTEYTYSLAGPGANNYVKAKNIFTPVSGSGLTEQSTWQYFDGLGRQLQTVEQQKSPSLKDIVTKTSYDNQGRPYRQFIDAQSPNSTGAYYGSTLTPYYTLTQYEPSPLNRPTSVTPPTWYATTTTYGANVANEVKLDGGSSYYAANTLSKTTVTDPNGNKTTIFTDKLGRLVLTRKEDSSGNNDTDTYNLYDDKNRLTKVLPPDATLSTPGLIFAYTYDERDRMATKKVPDAATMTYWYNNRDLMIFMQDGNLLANNQRLCTYHDTYGRPTKTGFVSHSSPPSGNDPQPLTADILTETTYGTSGISKGKVTYSKAKELGTSNFLDTYFYYDTYGRLSYSTGDNHLYSSTTAERTDYTYDFADNILTQNRDHRPNSSTLTTVDETFSYDHWGRPIDHDHRINGGGTVRLSNNVYNSRSQLIQKNLHLTPSSYYLQNVDYTYNTLGWLTAINNFQCIDTGGGGSSSAQAPTGEGFEVEVGYDANAGGGGFQATAPGFKVRVSGKVSTGDGGLSNQVLIEKVFGVQAGTDASFTASQLQAVYGQTQLPSSAATSLADTKITYSNMGETLLEVEEKLLGQLEQAGVAAEFGVLLTNEARRALEEAWLPISAAGFAAAEEEAIANGMAAAGGPTGGPSDDLFAMKLYYNVSNSTLGATAQKNGNIAYLGWQVGCNDPAFYGMQYDHLDRITKATYADLDKNTNAYKNLDRNTVDLLGYDKRGNINRIRRRGLNYGTTYNYIDNLYLYYASGTNKLNSVSESTGIYYKTKGFKSPTGGTKYYTHDANGNLISDGHKGITTVEYNHLNLPKKVTWSNGDWMEWTYDANGTKIKKTTSAGSTKHYINGIEYNGSTVEAIYYAEGRASWQGSAYRYEYTLRDHLGNSRVMFSDLNSDNEVDETEILQQNHYYPFGMNIEGSWSGGTNKYQYNGKELNTDFGLDWLDYGARWYDASIGRWGQIDPLAGKYTEWSPYNYVFNNPIVIVDPTGKEGIVVSGQPGDHNNQKHFLENGLDRAQALARQFRKDGKGEKATWIIYDNGNPKEGGYKEGAIDNYKAAAEKAGINVMIVSDSDEIVDYVNEKNGDDSRENDKVSNFVYIGHAVPGTLSVGYESHSWWDDLTHDSLDPSDFKSSAFTDASCANLVGGCRTAISATFSRSAADQMADKVGGDVKASNVRVFYPGGVVSDKQMVKKNNGEIIIVKGRKNKD